MCLFWRQEVVIQPELHLAFLDGFALGPAPLNKRVCAYAYKEVCVMIGLEGKEPFCCKSFLDSLLQSAGRWLKGAGNTGGAVRHSESSSLGMQSVR